MQNVATEPNLAHLRFTLFNAPEGKKSTTQVYKNNIQRTSVHLSNINF